MITDSATIERIEEKIEENDENNLINYYL